MQLPKRRKGRPAEESPRLDGSGPKEEAERETPHELARVRERDRGALEAFFDRHFDRVYGLAYRLLGNDVVAQDAAQEVFFKVHRAVHQLDPSRDPKPWLTAITYNTCREFWRSGAHKLALRSVSMEDSTEGALVLPAAAEDPESQLLLAERERQVQRAILDLPEPLRVAVILHDYEGLGHEQIAAMTGVTHAAARKRYSRALTELTRALKAWID